MQKGLVAAAAAADKNRNGRLEMGIDFSGTLCTTCTISTNCSGKKGAEISWRSGPHVSMRARGTVTSLHGQGLMRYALGDEPGNNNNTCCTVSSIPLLKCPQRLLGSLTRQECQCSWCWKLPSFLWTVWIGPDILGITPRLRHSVARACCPQAHLTWSQACQALHSG